MSGAALHPLLSIGARCARLRPGAWRLSIPEGPEGVYRIAQLDDYRGLSRRSFPWRAPIELCLRARVSAPDLPGTWGFGFWNDPFALRFGIGASRRIPALPNAVWFFYASPPNYLALSDLHPAQGLLAATFAAPRLPAPFLLAALPALPLLAWRMTARLLRRAARWVVRDDAAVLEPDPTSWHSYRLAWHADRVAFYVDDRPVFTTPVCPVGPLGLVMWIDNQTMAFGPDGRLRSGTPAGPEGHLDLASLNVSDLGDEGP